MRARDLAIPHLALFGGLALAGVRCAQPEPAPPAVHAAQALSALDTFGNPADLAPLTDGGLLVSQTGGCGAGFKCACRMQWAYGFINVLTAAPTQAAVAVASVDAPPGSDLALSAQVCRLVSNLPDCTNGLVASGGPVSQGSTAAATWITFDLTAGRATLAVGELGALVVSSDARQSSCASGDDTQTVTLPNVGPDLPLGPDDRHDNLLAANVSGVWTLEPFEPVFGVSGPLTSSNGTFDIGMGTPYSGGRVLDRLDAIGLGQSFRVRTPLQVFSVGVALDPRGTPAPATGAIIKLDGGTAIGGLSFAADDDGGSFWWANLPDPVTLPAGGYQLLLDRAGDGGSHWSWHRDVLTNDPAPGNVSPDLATYQSTGSKALNQGQGDDYVFLVTGVSCQVAETCGDGLDNDCNGVPDDGCPRPSSSSSGSSSAGSSGGSSSTGSGTTGSGSSSGSSSASASSTTGTSSSSSSGSSSATGTSSSSAGSSSAGSSSGSMGTSSSGSTGASSTSGGSTGGGNTSGGSATGGNPLPGPDRFALSGCGCTTLADPGFGALALLLLGFRKRKRG